MTGKIMIVDGVATNRILMKVRLISACHDVTAFGSAHEIIQALNRDTPDIILIGESLPDMASTDLCRLIRSLPGCTSLPIMMKVNDAHRLAALNAGANAIIHGAGDDLTLFARIRGLLRDRSVGPVDEEAEAAFPAHSYSGLEEALVPFDHQAPPRVAFITNRSASALVWRQALQKEMGHQISILDQDEALDQARSNETADIYLISVDIDKPGDGLQLLSELRSRGHSRHAGFLVVLGQGQSELASVALDLGAGDVLPDLFSMPLTATEAALRIHNQMDRKRMADRQRRTAERNRIWAMRDPLTDLFNRRYALPRLEEMLAHAIGSNQPLAVVALDIDHFKRVNDLYGHPSGDAILTAVAQRLAQVSPENALLARIGGEEFLIAFHPMQNQEASLVANTIRSAIANSPFALPGLPQTGGIVVTASLGVSVLPHDTFGDNPSAQTLMACADHALLQAKAHGRDQVVILGHKELA